MSLVGPRPALATRGRGVTTSGIAVGCRVKPGITGLWQVEARARRTSIAGSSLDLDYIDRWSLWLDLRIIVRTVPAMLQGR